MKVIDQLDPTCIWAPPCRAPSSISQDGELSATMVELDVNISLVLKIQPYPSPVRLLILLLQFLIGCMLADKIALRH